MDLQQELAQSQEPLPIIFITGHGDIPMSVRAMKAGAVEFLTKPFRDQELLDAIQQALKADRAAREQRVHAAEVRRRYESLTAREREVMQLVVTGLLNKQIAGELGISEITVKMHRGQVMHKMEAESVVELLRMAEAIATTDAGDPIPKYHRTHHRHRATMCQAGVSQTSQTGSKHEHNRNSANLGH